MDLGCCLSSNNTVETELFFQFLVGLGFSAYSSYHYTGKHAGKLFMQTFLTKKKNIDISQCVFLSNFFGGKEKKVLTIGSSTFQDLS